MALSLLIQKASKVMKSADKVAKKAKATNVTLDDWLETLAEERKQHFKTAEDFIPYHQ